MIAVGCCGKPQNGGALALGSVLAEASRMEVTFWRAVWHDVRMDDQGLIEVWDAMLDRRKSWVLFENGTCVVLAGSGSVDLASRAADLLAEFGPFVPGTPSADFDVIIPDDVDGWVIASQHPDIMTYVARDEGAGEESPMVGIYGRDKRARDADGRRVIHVHEGLRL